MERSNRYLYDGEAILVPGEGRLGEIFHYINGKFDYHQRVYKISDFNGVAAKFVMYSMMRDFKKHALQNTAKATVDSIRLPTLTEFQLSLPKPKEQKKIGQYFSQIDSLITLHQREPTNQNMSVSVVQLSYIILLKPVLQTINKISALAVS